MSLPPFFVDLVNNHEFRFSIDLMFNFRILLQAYYWELVLG